MKRNEYINDLMDHYDQAFTKIALRDIKRYLGNKNISDEKYQAMYDYIIQRSNFLPGLKDIIESEKNAVISGPQKLHGQSPQQQLLQNHSRPADELYIICKTIRQKINNDDQVSTAEISFLYVWEDITRIPPEQRENMKQLIIDGNKRARDEIINKYNKSKKIIVETDARAARAIPAGKAIKQNFKKNNEVN